MPTELSQVDPSKLRIDLYPTDVLRMKASPVAVEEGIDESLRAIAERMIVLMRSAQGIGLAAPQVGLPIRLFVAHVPHDPEAEPDESGLPVSTDDAQVFFNPEIVEFSRDLEPYEEGCLSLPGINGEVNRPSTVTMRAFDLAGNEIELRATGLLARCWQHEIDHLDGVLIIDKMSQMSRLKNRARIKSMEKAAKR
ncbi:MAG: peptide deformylase [Phycisphaerales bacterium]|nr:peptide deformylase [Phycisphaerales bacterium]